MKLATIILVQLTGLMAVAQETRPAKIEDLAELHTKAENGDVQAQFGLG